MGLSINPNFVPALAKSAVASIGIRAAQMASPGVIQAAQKLFSILDKLDSIFGTPFVDIPNPQLGYLTPNQVKATAKKMSEMGPARKNLFFVRMTDLKPPGLYYAEKRTEYNKNMPKEPDKLTPTTVLDILVLDVSYSPSTLTGEKVNIGSVVMDKITGTEAVEIQITTMDDDVGTLKRWFDGKVSQAANADGTFGVPMDYMLSLQIVHGVASSQMDQQFIDKAYKREFWVRPVSCSHELSKREQAPSELQMTFTQVDTWPDGIPEF
jgi:hypothetical protein